MPRRDLRVGVFVDAANIYACANDKFGKKVDYRKLLDFAVGENIFYRAVVYAVEHTRTGDSGQEKESSINGWVQSLQSFGYEVKTKEVVAYENGRTKADWDVELCMDVVRMINSIDIVVIVSGDGDFIPLVELCQSRGKIVRVIGVEYATNIGLKKKADIFDPVSESILFQDRRTEDKRQPKKPAPAPAVRSNRNTSKDLGITEEERKKLDQELDEMENGTCPFEEPEVETAILQEKG